MSSISKAAALRIALASRALGLENPASFIAALGGKLGLPIDEHKLAGLTVEDLRALLIGDEELEIATDIAAPALKQAVRYLWGEQDGDEALPAASSDELPGGAHLRVAVASNSQEMLDGHFGSCPRFLIYDVSTEQALLRELRSTAAADASDDRNAARAELIGDCQLLYVQSIGGPAAAKVIRAGVHPLKFPKAAPAQEALAKLQAVLPAPPPWLAKVMGVESRSLARFAVDLES
ncbi:dinitrogenase iron-molybdenum cofactor biosynthesis protein [Pseudomonas kuykendallii]|uniref:Nitrogen fixation protein NifX n=1 Tax=Pseudomonas kuykendallii TaxID=1007099 RepID=A0A1H3FAJ8_9PSED|nr:dinitrogenase iron-molybdenum cofactor biosynthesis protein [Pseudomonas kuykendallii]MCQ4272421.1 dinitrogenase iron-molybdenum cofactor biosynthesis protein [Pseudomonas kuykendallii]SDX88026.1 nitrogen fixation protein NifX [Pseudomonas kuykendallii]